MGFRAGMKMMLVDFRSVYSRTEYRYSYASRGVAPAYFFFLRTNADQGVTIVFVWKSNQDFLRSDTPIDGIDCLTRNTLPILGPRAPPRAIMSDLPEIHLDKPSMKRDSHKNMRPQLAKTVVHARKSKGLTQSELAERVGLSLRTIVRIEKSEALPSLDTAFKIAAELQISALELIGGDDLLPLLRNLSRESAGRLRDAVDQYISERAL